MQSTIVLINLLGAVSLLLFGLGRVKDGISRAFGARLRYGLAAGTRSVSRSFLSGFFATVALQSSTATALMVASFSERALIAPRMAQIVMLGANLGTAVTAWIVASGVSWLSPLVIVTGYALGRNGSVTRQGSGNALVGIGLMLLSLHLLDGATETLRTSPALSAFIQLLGNALPVAMSLAAIIAVISSSSLATIVLIVSLSATGLLPTELTMALVLGANLGGAVPPVLATLSSPTSARRVTMGNLLVRATGCLVCLPVIGVLTDLLRLLPVEPANLPVDLHLLFNLLLTLLALPCVAGVSLLMRRLVPDDHPSDDAPRYLDPAYLATPVVALANATREVLGVGDLIDRMLSAAHDALDGGDPKKLEEISICEKRIDRVHREVKFYVSALMRESLEEHDASRALEIIDYALNLEHVGDLIEKGVLNQLNKKAARGVRFSEDGQRELSRFFRLSINNLRIAQTVFATGDTALARQLMELKVDVRKMERQSSTRHLIRLKDGQAESLETSSMHLDMLRDLKRINAHIASVANSILDREGQLLESRVLSDGLASLA
ncbi:Na/Pi cotransporter family protein [Agrobacterium sp. 22-214-1]